MEVEHRRWERLHELFGQAVDLRAAEREAFIASNCSDDALLREELQALLDSDDDEETGPITGIVGSAVEAVALSRRHELVGTVLGPYKLTEVLGHGGAGTVYLGERVDQQYSAQVAIKVVEGAQFHADVLQRFRAEQQILAGLNHPYIGRLLDAGHTDKGAPYLVMEYIRGEPVDRYCDNQHLNVTARLKLFIKVCEAVQFAHQNLIVHRDIKPANILVTLDGMPKLLDFGIAKPLHLNDTDAASAITRVDRRVLTLEYASPEQILGHPITTSSDVYSLGVLLFELLTGVRPLSGPTESYEDLERSICTADPPKPSTVASKEHSAARWFRRKVSMNRALHESSSRLRNQLAGDLDAILLRALRKEPSHRYRSVEQFSSDVQKHLAHQPVMARHGNWVYYAQRFLQQHLVGVTVSIVGLCVLASVTANTWLLSRRISFERDRATQEQQRAEAVSSFMLEVFADEDSAPGKREITARELLDKAGARINRELNQQPEVRARLLGAIGSAYNGQGQAIRAIPYLEDALALSRSLSQSDAFIVRTLYVLGLALLDEGKFSAASEAFMEAMGILRRRHEQDSLEFIQLLKGMGGLEHSRGKIDEAERYMQEGLALALKLYGSQNIEVADLSRNLANLLVWKENLPAAEKMARQAVEIYRAKLAELHPDASLADALLGQILFLEGKIDESTILLQRSIAAQRTIFGGQGSARILNALNDLSSVRLTQRRDGEAEELAREAVRMSEGLFGEQHYQSGYARTALADVLMKRGRLKEAEETVRSSLEILTGCLPPDHQYIASAEYQLGLVLLQTHQLPEATHRLVESMQRWERSGAPPWRAARSESALGEALLETGKLGEAENHLANAYRILTRDLGPNDETTRSAMVRLQRYRASQRSKP